MNMSSLVVKRLLWTDHFIMEILQKGVVLERNIKLYVGTEGLTYRFQMFSLSAATLRVTVHIICRGLRLDQMHEAVNA